MSFRRAYRLCLIYSILVIIGILVPRAVQTQPFEYVITFNNVVVRGVDSVETPDVVHRELPGSDKSSSPSEPGLDRSMRGEPTGPPPKPWETGTDRVKGGEGGLGLGQSPRITMRLPGSLLPSEPGQGTGNPSFGQEGFLVEAFWAGKIGTREGFFKHAHFHPPDLSTGFEAQHLGNPDEL